ncbi:MAG: ATP-grasp domain-containing protein [Bacteroidota bacterium]|jgi:carbamoyl-phosphate synthase large subunit
MKRKLTIAVTGLNNIDSPGPGIPVIRGLRDSKLFDVRIIGLSYDALEPGIYMHDLVDKSYQIPLPSAGQNSLLTRLEYIHQQEKLDVIIPNFDAELYNFIKLQDALKQLGIHTFLPTLEQFEERHKWALTEFGQKYNIMVPKSKMINSLAEVHGLAFEFGYPLVVKGKFYDAAVAYSPDQAMAHFNKISGKWGLPIIIQQYTPGTEVNLTGLGDGKGLLTGAVPMRKTYITDKGKAWAGVALQDEKLMDIARKLVNGNKWRGGFELEMIRTDKNDYYLIEINPRFPAWVYLAVGAGQNHPEALVQLALGENVEPFSDYEVGKMFVRYSYDQIVDLKEFENISTYGEL